MPADHEKPRVVPAPLGRALEQLARIAPVVVEGGQWRNAESDWPTFLYSTTSDLAGKGVELYVAVTGDDLRLGVEGWHTHVYLDIGDDSAPALAAGVQTIADVLNGDLVVVVRRRLCITSGQLISREQWAASPRLGPRDRCFAASQRPS